MSRLMETLKLYSFANKKRDEFYNVKWRLFVGLMIVVLFWNVASHLWQAYPNTPANVVASATSGTQVQAAERMLNWFITGFFAGFIAFAIMFEGEFLLATSKVAKQLNAELRGVDKSIRGATALELSKEKKTTKKKRKTGK